MVSRSPQAYMKRKGLLPTVLVGPRLDLYQLLIHKYDTGQSLLKSQLAEGCNPPDRPVLKPWVSRSEELENE